VRNRTFLVMRSVAVLAALPAVLLGGAGVAAADGITRAEPDNVTFGLLGPVGLAAVALGVVGMTAGVIRQRRRAQAVEETTETAQAAEATSTEAAEATRPVPTPSPVPRHTDVTAMAEAVLAEESTRPAATPARRRPVA
jgi:hypothetical protein